MSTHHNKSHGSKSAQHGSKPRQTPQTQTAAVQTGLTPKRLFVVLGLMVVAFFGAYNFASARSQAPTDIGTAVSNFYAPPAGGAGGCCGGGGAPVEGSASVEGGVQKIAVDTSSGSFNPNVIKVKAGVPIEIAFSQSPGGCLSGVMFPDFNVSEDLTGGPKTVKLPALEKGSYTFYCQMQMISAQIVAE